MSGDEIIPAPTLSSTGWVKAGGEKADYLLAYFFETKKSQSYVYSGNLVSVQYLLQQFAHAPDTLVSEMNMELERFLSRYYPKGVSCDCTHDATSDNNTYTVSIRALIVENDASTYSLSKALEIENSKIKKIITYNNDGEVISL